MRRSAKGWRLLQPIYFQVHPSRIVGTFCRLFLLVVGIIWILPAGIQALAAPPTVPHSRRQRSVDKARAKLEAFAASSSAHHRRRRRTVLVVDGNNVRGIGQGEWSPVEWMERIAAFCDAYQIDHHVVVWDHGPFPMVLAPPRRPLPTKSLCLFAGLSQRADDVIVQEAPYLREYLCGVHDNNDNHDDVENAKNHNNFHNFCFVTNDGGLQGRLRRLGSDPRLRVLNTNGPLLLDATRFIALVQELPRLEASIATRNSNHHQLHRSVQRAEEQLRAFAVAQQTTRYHPKREQTWHRCVLADAMVRGYVEQWQDTVARAEDEDHHPSSDRTSTAINSYIRNAVQRRGFQTLPQVVAAALDNNLKEGEEERAVAGSRRLDKKQKRMLAKYNKLWKQGMVMTGSSRSLFERMQDAIEVKDQWILGHPHRRSEYPADLDVLFPAASMLAAQTEIKSWPLYQQPTALIELPNVAQHAGVARVLYKDESTRFGLGSFKALGGAYAVVQYLAAEVSQQLGRKVTMESIRLGGHKDTVRTMMVTTATDGNHGRSVAWGAQLAGCQCSIYVHKDVSVGREQAMHELGATVIRIAGNYDESVKVCASDAIENGWQMISDTSYEGYTSIPTHIMSGYSLLVDEILAQSSTSLPTHVFIQAGVGGLAAAVAAGFWSRLGKDCPRIIIVESEHADCILRSLKAGKPTPVNVETETIMAGLSCGEISLIAWEILKRCTAGAISINDDAVPPAMRYMAAGDAANGTMIEAGECAVPGILALLASAQDATLHEAFALNKDSTVLLFGCEGATDPVLYDSIMANDDQ